MSSERLLDELKKIIKSKFFLKLFKDNFSQEIIKLIFPQLKNFRIFDKLNSFAKKKIDNVDYIFLISLMIIDETDNTDYFLFKFNISNFNKKRILFLKQFYDKKIDKNFFSKKNLCKILYFDGKQSLEDLIYFEIFRSKNENKKLITLIDYFKNKEVPIFPIKGRDIMKKYNIPEGKLLGEKLKKIEENWINNDFKILDEDVKKIIEN